MRLMMGVCMIYFLKYIHGFLSLKQLQIVSCLYNYYDIMLCKFDNAPCMLPTRVTT